MRPGGASDPQESPPSTLSWWHHRLVSAKWLTPGQREQLLDASERERLTTRELEARLGIFGR